MRLLLLLISASLLSCAAMENVPGGGATSPILSEPTITEASGLAVSRRDPSFLWLLNDSGAPARVYLANTDGTARGFVTLRDTKNKDWEDLAAFKLGGVPHLLIADTGDNEAKRETVSLHLIREPALPTDQKSTFQMLTPNWTIRFRYEDGPRDCESVAFDPQSKTILLLTKRDNPPVLYQLPLRRPTKREILVAKRLGPIAKPPLPSKSLPHPFHAQPTGLDISSDSLLAAVVTYRGAYLYPRATSETWAQAFAKAPQTLGAHGLAQAEAIALTPDGRGVIVTSEGKHPRLITFPTP